MKDLKIEKTIRYLFCILLFISVLFTVCACTAMEQNEYAEQVTESILDAIIAKDYGATRSIFNDIASDEAFDDFYETMSEMFDETKSYELKQVGWYTHIDNGVSTYSVTFEMETDGGKNYIIESYFLKGDNSLYYFHVVPDYSIQTEVLIPIQITLALVSLASVGFCIWMIIDCAKRKMDKKPLWIIIILLGFSITCTFGNSVGIRFMLKFVLSISTISGDSLSVGVPIGAIVYCIMRKKLTRRDPEPEAVESAEFTSETEDSAGSTPTESENE